ncbi:homoserine O-acetyltransferase/O-succinyltransferase family protein [Altericroceibacterium endophyticum]|uniref:Homoserine O-acetyltransferase n=1 Tax=Altericroceibacterium endophyticum TaxID=1808508 RepID=A0A6I4T9U3_9SPHN|nr:homoserine O-succinyltransferase [Altericroceibacterium endophyticum]
MPITIPDDLPARRQLEEDGVIVMSETDAVRQEIRPLRIGLLNLMPDKINTEAQLARLLGGTPLQIELTLVSITGHVPRNTPLDHMDAFYRSWEDVRNERFDGFIITGAPVEHLAFEDVTYWSELQDIFNWTQTNVHRSLMICWAAQAALYHFYGVQKQLLAHKAYGIFEHRNLAATSPYLRGFSDEFAVPVSRWTEVSEQEIAGIKSLEVLADSAETGLCLLDDARHSMLYMFNHLEYDADTLAREYQRDQLQIPANYFPDGNPELPVRNNWRSHAQLLFGNWINEIYQTTSFDFV